VADHVFETASSETLHRGNIFALRRDQVRMPGGNVATREVVEHYGAVAIVAMDDNNNIPMVYQYRHTFRRRLWELPAGLLDVAGEPPHLTAARELKDEEADMTMRWVPIDEAARLVLAGEVLNSIAVAGILAAHAVTIGFAQPRPVDSPWIDKPTSFAARKAGR
jgi:hypothetical protein